MATLDSGVVPDDLSNFSTRVVSKVYNLGALNPLGPGGLTFTYTVQNVADGGLVNDPLVGLSVDFGNVGTIDINSVVGSGIGSANVPGLALYFGSQLTFVWTSDSILEGETSTTLVVHTTYNWYKHAKAGVIDTTTEDVNVLVPDMLVPEPTTYAGLFALGLAGFATYRRFRA